MMRSSSVLKVIATLPTVSIISIYSSLIPLTNFSTLCILFTLTFTYFGGLLTYTCFC